MRYALAEIGAAEAGAGRREEALRIARQLEDDSAREPDERLQPEMLGYLYAQLGDHDRAFAWLERACESHDPRMVFLNIDPVWNNLRGDARFRRLLKRMRFV